MKKRIMNAFMKYTGLFFVLLLLCAACEDQNEPTPIEIQKPFEKSDLYYENLRAYKRSPHQLAFGWFGGWTAMGASAAKYLSSVPDSVDLVAIWGKWNELSEAQYEDMKQVREIKGTKVIFTIFAHEVPEPFEATKEGIESYARAMVDSVNKYGYDGLDLDYEPNFGGKGPLVKKDNMEIFVRELGKHLGPQSGTGLLFVIDGEPHYLNQGLAELFDYGIVQAYDAYSDANLQDRFNAAAAVGWKPGQYIYTENFEKLWRTGGTTSYRDKNDKVMNSLKGMARFQPLQGQKGGCGTYHMEYEYNHTDSDYKYLREAIQIMNPAVK